MSESKIREVSVYKSGCIVKRQGTVHLEKGSRTVKLYGLRAAEGNAVASDTVKLAVDESAYWIFNFHVYLPWLILPLCYRRGK